jgi:hypothetical protein
MFLGFPETQELIVTRKVHIPSLRGAAWLSNFDGGQTMRPESSPDVPPR